MADRVARDHVGHRDDEEWNGERCGHAKSAPHVGELFIFSGIRDRNPPFERHSADGARAGSCLDNLRVHWAGELDLGGISFRCRVMMMMKTSPRSRHNHHASGACEIELSTIAPEDACHGPPLHFTGRPFCDSQGYRSASRLTPLRRADRVVYEHRYRFRRGTQPAATGPNLADPNLADASTEARSCPAANAQPSWLDAFLAEHVAKLTGVGEVSAGVRLTDRATPDRRRIART